MNNNNQQYRAAPQAIDSSIEPRLAGRLAAALTVRANDLPQGVSERLRFAREQASSSCESR